jgi:signal transduction histidine kinase/DNA-binding response OmpR family regulator
MKQKTNNSTPYDSADALPVKSQFIEKRRLNQLKALQIMGQTVTSSLDLETVFDTVLQQIVKVVHATGASILLSDANGLYFAAACGKGSHSLKGQHVPLQGSVAGIVFQTAKALVITDAVTSKRVHRPSGQLTGQTVGSLLAAPLRIGDQTLGVMEAVHTQQNKFGDDDLRLLETAASWASIAIRNARQHADLERQIQERSEMELARQTAEASNRAKSEFLANMSHEIRTPMNAILGFSHLALKSASDTKQKDYLTKVQSSAYLLLQLLDNILNYSKLEAGRVELEVAPFRLDLELERLAMVFSANAAEKDLKLNLSIAPDVPVELLGDPVRLLNALENFVDNAIKFTEQGSILINVETQKYQDSMVTLRFTFRDTGIGMSTTQIAQLFQPFVQADASTTRKYGGLGLGLAISKRLIDIMDGTITVESKPSVGSVFTVILPFFLQPETPKHQVMPAIRGNLRVLVVDDDSSSCLLFENILRSMKFAVSITSSGLAALAELERAIQAQEQPYDLVILDCKAPGQDGLGIAHSIKTNQRLPQAPAIIVTTTHGNQTLFEQANQLHLDGFLLKPINSSLLLDCIQDIFWQRWPSQADAALLAQLEEQHTEALIGKRVLLVEDNEINRQIAREIMQKVGITVLEAQDGQQAIEMVLKYAAQLDAVLMDVAMPGMDGYEATRRILSRPIGKALPIIAMTANAFREDRQKSLQAGMVDHIAKPIDPQEFLNVLTKQFFSVPGGANAEPLTNLNNTQTEEAAYTPSSKAKLKEFAKPEIIPPATKNDPSAIHELKPLLLELSRLLEQCDTEALSVVGVLQEHAQNAILQKQLVYIQARLQEYDFIAATKALEVLLSE